MHPIYYGDLQILETASANKAAHDLAFPTLSHARQSGSSYIGLYCMLTHASKLLLESPRTVSVPTDPSVARHCRTLIPGLVDCTPQLQLTTVGVYGAAGGAEGRQAENPTDAQHIRNTA